MKLKLTSQRKSLISLVTLMLILTLPFQNCGGNFETVGDGTTVAGSSSIQGGSNQPPTSNPPPPPQGGEENPPPPPPPPPQDGTTDQQRRAACIANFNAPTLSNVTPAEITMNSGMGQRSGDTTSLPNVTVTGAMSIKDNNVQTANACATYTVFRVQCDIVVDSSRPANITKAIALNGDNVAGSATTDAAKRTLIGRAITLQGCENRSLLNNGTNTFNVRLNRGQNHVRCVQGSFYVAVKSFHEVSGEDKESAPRYVKVNLNDGCWNESKLKMSGNQEFPVQAQAGAASAIDGNWAAIIAPMQNMGSVLNAGAVHVYNFDGSKWNFHSTLQPSDAQTDDNLSAVALKGDTLVISSAYRKGHGGVLVYKLAGNSWNLAQNINPPDTQSGQGFGMSLSYDGSRLAVGAPHFSRSGSDRAGVVYVYTQSNGNFFHQDTLSVPDQNYANKGFGMSVSLSGNLLAVGAPQAITKEALGKGDVRIFQLSGSTWSQVAVKTPGTGFSNSNGLRFGASVALSGNRLIIGAPGHNGNNDNTNAGAVAYYANYTSSSATKVWSSNTKNGRMGTAVGLSSGGLFIGGPFSDGGIGIVDYYANNNTTDNPTYRMMSTNRKANDGFGSSIGIAGDKVIVGARSMSDPQNYSGAAYIYQMK